MTIDWSFPRRILITFAASVGLAVYPLAAYGSPKMMTGAVSGAVLMTANALFGFAAIERSYGKPAAVFFRNVLGGMVIRLMSLAVALIALIKVFDVDIGALLISVGFFYVVYLILEIVYIQKRFTK